MCFLKCNYDLRLKVDIITFIKLEKKWELLVMHLMV